MSMKESQLVFVMSRIVLKNFSPAWNSLEMNPEILRGSENMSGTVPKSFERNLKSLKEFQSTEPDWIVVEKTETSPKTWKPSTV